MDDIHYTAEHSHGASLTDAMDDNAPVLILGMMSSILAPNRPAQKVVMGLDEEEWKYQLLPTAISPNTGDTEQCSKGFIFKTPDYAKTNSEGRNLPQIKSRHSLDFTRNHFYTSNCSALAVQP